MTKITCATGIALFNAYRQGGDPTAVLCRLKGVERPEELSRAELRELTDLSEAFNRAALLPKDVREVKLEFTLGEYFVSLGRFSELDITLQALDLVEDFNPEDLERMPVMLGCIYAPLVREMFALPMPVARVAADLADAIREQTAFEDVYAVYDFFGVWKETFTTEPHPSFKRSMSSYRLRQRADRPTRALIARLLTRSPRRCGPIMRVIGKWRFTIVISSALLSRWFWLTTERLRVWWKKKRKK